jgi:DNA-binding transcriptional LysR family regulator
VIESLRALVVFTTVIEQGTFRAAARELGLSASVVSHHVSNLEERLGSPLLYRSTRRLDLTSAGRTIYEQAKAMIAAATTGLHEAAAASRSAGTLRITMPIPLASTPVMSAISSFANENEQIELLLVLDDMNHNLIESGCDCAIRMGFFPANALPGRVLFHEPRVIVAAPDYALEREDQWSIEDLAAAAWVHFLPTSRTLDFYLADQARSITIAPRVSTNSSVAVRHMLLDGVGIGRLPLAMVDEDIRKGRLVELPSEWRLRPLPVFATWPSNETTSGLVHEFIEYIAARVRALPQDESSAKMFLMKSGIRPTTLNPMVRGH